MRALESLARADASVAWTVMIGAGSWIDLAHLPRETFDALYATNPDAITAGVFNPTASITPVDGGYRVNGRWSFASGCEHADVIFGNGVEGIVDGMPQLRGAVFAPGDVTIEDTWSVSGLCGTGSHHFHVDGAVVPAERTYDPMGGEPCIDALIVHLPPPAVFSLVMASVALGIAQGALDDITRAGLGQGAAALTGRPRREPAVPARPGHRRHRPAGGAKPPLRGGRADLGDRGGGRPADDGAASARTGLRRVGRRPGDLGRHHRLPGRRRNLAVLRLPAPASPPRHPRPRPALHRPPRHARHRGRDPRRPGRPAHGVLAPRGAQAAGRVSPRRSTDDAVGEARDTLTVKGRPVPAAWRSQSGDGPVLQEPPPSSRPRTSPTLSSRCAHAAMNQRSSGAGDPARWRGPCR